MHTLGNIALYSNVKNQSLSLSNSLQVINNCNRCKSNKHNCPLKVNCINKNSVYKVKVISCDKNKVYIGSTGEHFKDRYIEDRSQHLIVKTKRTAHVYLIMCRNISTGMVKNRK